MKKIITAINNPKLNEELKKENNFKIIGKDIQYKEAILETLEKNKNIDIIIISEQILGEINFEKLIKKIKLINEKIKIIFILEIENNELEKILKENNINEIYYNNKINLFELIKIINKKEINMEEEIIKLKKIIKENNINYNKKENNYLIKNNLNKKIEKNKKNKLKNKKIKLKKENNKLKDYKNQKALNQKEDKKAQKHKMKKCKKKEIKHQKSNIMLNKIITFSGNNKSGKTSLAIILSKYLTNKNYKVLIVDVNLNKKNINPNIKNKILENIKTKNKVYFNKNYLNKNIIKKYKELKKINNYNTSKIIKIFTNKISNNFYICIALKILIKKYKEKNIYKKINLFIKETKNNYDFIIFDISKKNPNSVNREIMKKSHKNFIIIEPNIPGIKETNELLNKYIKNWKINKNSLHIIENKSNFNSINKNVISNILEPENKIIRIKEYKNFNRLINNYLKRNNFLFNKKLKKENKKIIKIIK